jgi:hypothetical protein
MQYKKIIMKNLFILLVASVLLASCNDYGKKVKKGTIEVYYKDGIGENEASHTAAILAEIDSAQNNNTKNTRSIQLLSQKDTVLFRMVADKSKLAGVDDMAFQVIGTIISDSAFSGKPVNVELTDNTFNTFKKIPYKKIDLNKLGE